MDREQAIKLMQDLLRRMVDRKGSDLFITSGFPPAIKIDGEVRPQTDKVLTPEQSAVLVRSIMSLTASVFALRNLRLDVRALGERLRVGVVLEGGVLPAEAERVAERRQRGRRLTRPEVAA